MIATPNNDSLFALFSSLFDELEEQHQPCSIDLGSDKLFKLYPTTRTSQIFEPIPLECVSTSSIEPEPIKSFHIINHNNQPKSALSAVCKATTQQSCSSAGVVRLNDNDVICGRSKDAFNHIGNRRFRVTISIFLRRYLDSPSRLDRSMLIYEIIDAVHECGSRFLKQSSSGNREWVELSQKERRDKVGHALRDAAAAYRRNNKNK